MLFFFYNNFIKQSAGIQHEEKWQVYNKQLQERTASGEECDIDLMYKYMSLMKLGKYAVLW